MIAGAIGGAAAAAWVVARIGAHVRTARIRRRLDARPGRATPVVPRLHQRPPAPVPAARVPVERPPTRIAGVDGVRRARSGRRPRRTAGRRRRGDAPASSPADVAALVASCDAISRSLRSGASLSVAVAGAAAAHGHPTLAAIARGTGVGIPLPEAIERALSSSADATSDVDADAALVLQVLGVAAEHGGAPAETIDRAAATVRERAALRAERHSQAASARLSGRVMTTLPFAFTGFVAATDADVRRILVATPLGWTCLATGLALNLAGRAWTARAVAG